MNRLAPFLTLALAAWLTDPIHGSGLFVLAQSASDVTSTIELPTTQAGSVLRFLAATKLTQLIAWCMGAGLVRMAIEIWRPR